MYICIYRCTYICTYIYIYIYIYNIYKFEMCIYQRKIKNTFFPANNSMSLRNLLQCIWSVYGSNIYKKIYSQ